MAQSRGFVWLVVREQLRIEPLLPAQIVVLLFFLSFSKLYVYQAFQISLLDAKDQ